MQWPSWLPIQITTLGVSWPKGFATNPTDIDLTLSATVQASFGGAFSLGGSVTDAVIDLGMLSTPNTFPIVSLAGAGLTVSGKLGGATISGGAFVAILRLDANNQVIADDDTTTPVVKRIFYGGVEGSLLIGSAAGIGVRIGLSQLGPLDIFVESDIPILLDPESGLAIQSLRGGIDFGQTLTTPSNAKQLATSDAYQPPDKQSMADWETALAKAVAQQATTDANSFAQFASTFTIHAGITLYDEYATANAFTLAGDIAIDTTGKLLATGTLTMGGTSGVSLQAGAFLDLSKVAQGAAQLLWYFKAPAAAPILSVYGAVTITVTNANKPNATIDVNISGEADLSVPGVQGGIALVGSADFLATPSQNNLVLTVSGTASLNPLGQFGTLAGQAYFDLNGNTPELYGAFYANIDSNDIPTLKSLGLQISAIGFVEFNTTKTVQCVKLTPPGQTSATTYQLAAQSVLLDVPNAKLAYGDVFEIDASLYASFALVTLPNGQVDPELDMTFNGDLKVGPANNRALDLKANGVLIISAAGLAANFNVTVGTSISGVSFDTTLALTVNSTGKDQSFTVPPILDPTKTDGTLLAGTNTTYTIPGAFSINGTPQSSGPYLAVVGSGDLTVESFKLNGSFDILVTPTLFRLDINQMSVNVSGLNGFSLTAQGGLLISTAGIAGAIAISAGSGVTDTSGFYSISGSFSFEVNTTSAQQTIGGIDIPADSAAVSVAGDVKVGNPNSGQFDVSASVTITISGSGVMLSLYGMAELGPLGELSVGSATTPSTLTISPSGLAGDLTLNGNLTPIAGTSLTGTFTLMFDTSSNLYKLHVGGDLTVGGGAFDLKGTFDLSESSAGFLVGGNFNLIVMGANLASGAFDATIYKDSDGSSELALYAGLTISSGSFAGPNLSFTASPSLSINTGTTDQNFQDGNSAPAETAIFSLQNASIEAFGFHASGSLIATISNGGFDIDIPQSDPISLSFLGLGSMQIYGDINSDGDFSITGQISYDVSAGPFELYGGIGATIANTGFSAWFYGGANLNCGVLGTVHLASISADITVMSDHVEIAASCHVLGIGFSFDESLGGYSPPAHSPGLAFYNAPSQAAAGSVPTLSASAYNPHNDAVTDGNYFWIVTGPPDVLNGNQAYFASSTNAKFTPTLGGAGTYYVSLYEIDSYGTTLLKQSTINVMIVQPTITSLNLFPSYLTTDSELSVPLYPSINSTNDALLGKSYWTVYKNGSTAGTQYNGLNPTISLDPTNQSAGTPDYYTAVLTVIDPYNGTVTMTGVLHTLDVYNLTVNDAGDEEKTGDVVNGNNDIAPSNGLLTLRRAIDIVNDNASFHSGITATIHFAPSLAGQTIYLDQEEFFDHGNLGTSDIGYSDLGIEYPTIIDGSAAPGLTITNAAASNRRLFFVGNNIDDGSFGMVSLTLKDLILKGGDATGWSNAAYGGALYITDNTTVNSDHVTFENNSANAQAIYSIGAQDAQGGAVYIDSGATFNAIDSTFSGNSANGSPNVPYGQVTYTGGNGYGGAIYNNNGSMNLIATTIAQNQVSGHGANFGTSAGAGIYAFGDGGSYSFSNTIVADDIGAKDFQLSSYTPSTAFSDANTNNLIETFSGSLPVAAECHNRDRPDAWGVRRPRGRRHSHLLAPRRQPGHRRRLDRPGQRRRDR